MSGNGRGKKFEIDEEMEKELFGDWGDNQDEEEEEGEDLFDDGLLTKYVVHLLQRARNSITYLPIFQIQRLRIQAASGQVR